MKINSFRVKLADIAALKKRHCLGRLLAIFICVVRATLKLFRPKYYWMGHPKVKLAEDLLNDM